MTDPAVRTITDSQVLVALAHPLRRRLMDVLRVDGPATASVLAERTGQAVGNVSHHLRTLARAELIVEAPELARDRRERWWRLASATIRWSSSDFRGDPAAEAVERAAVSIQLDQQQEHVRAYAAAPDEVRDAWPTGPFATHHWLRVTDAELAQLAGEVIGLLTRWSEREIPDDGQQRGSVLAFARAVPASP